MLKASVQDAERLDETTNASTAIGREVIGMVLDEVDRTPGCPSPPWPPASTSPARTATPG
ncbi:hypothetical protein GCM10011512_05860 [Tersicoccus solisilvae]|uniref:Uncharacterized protein n=1 Tax=Tersicoccus solisilvae TaxID=1882339 RepID=A0ABQ1NPT7_9MICC|nr:hypothetical protein GCM10011512_05860 [Tersicoccus solisilvae]